MRRQLIGSVFLLGAGGAALLALISAAPPPAARAVAGVLDAADFGARGNGVADDTDAIQRALDLAGRRAPIAPATTVYLPPGRYRVTRTLRVGPASGVTLCGAGHLPADPRATGHFGGSALVWDGPAGGTLLAGTGTTALSIEGLTLIGRPAPKAANRAGILLHAAPMKGWGTGGWSLRRVSCFDAAVAVQFGSDVSDLNCDQSRFEQVIFSHCDAGFRVKNDQGVCFAFDSPGVFDCGVAFDLERGGNLHVYGAPAVQGCDWLLRSGPGGRNVAVSTFTNVRVEGDLKLAVGAFRNVVLADCQMSEPWGVYKADVDPNSTLDVRGGRLRK